MGVHHATPPAQVGTVPATAERELLRYHRNFSPRPASDSSSAHHSNSTAPLHGIAPVTAARNRHTHNAADDSVTTRGTVVKSYLTTIRHRQ